MIGSDDKCNLNSFVTINKIIIKKNKKKHLGFNHCANVRCGFRCHIKSRFCLNWFCCKI